MTKLAEQDIYRLADWGYGCYQQGDLRRARILFAAILEAKPADSYAARGLAAVALQQGQAEEAIALMVTVLQKRPEDLAARLRLVEALIAADRIAEAWQGIAAIRGEAAESDVLRMELRLRQAAPPNATLASDAAITSA